MARMDEIIRCSFCNKPQSQVRKLISGPNGVYICDECVDAVSYTHLVAELFNEVNPIPVKKAVELMGLPSGGLRMPLVEISKEHEAALVKAMKEFGIKLI